MVFFQLTINARDPARLAQFWALALGWRHTPPDAGDSTWLRHYRRRLGERPAFEDRLFDPEGVRPAIWFQHAPDAVTGGNLIHLDLYPTGRDDAMPWHKRWAVVESKVDELVAAGAAVTRRESDEDPADPLYFVVMSDPEGNPFCVS